MEEFIKYLDGAIAEGKAEIARLYADGRKDESDLAKVRTNIYEVCRTVSLALINRPGAGKAAVMAQFGRFREAWGAALEKAKQHDDASAAAVEEIKLAALEDVIARFEGVTEA